MRFKRKGVLGKHREKTEVMVLMKRLSVVMMSVLVAVLLSGCLESDLKVKLNADGSGVVTIEQRLDKSVIDQGMATEEDIEMGTEEEIEELEAEGYKVTQETTDEHFVVTATKSFDDINKLDLDTGDGESELEFKLEQDKGLTKTVNKLTVTSGEVTENVDDDILASGMTDMLGGMIDVTFTLELPAKPVEHNATSEDGNVLVWDLVKHGDETIEVEYEAGNKSTLMMAGILVIAVLGTLVYVGYRKKQ